MLDLWFTPDIGRREKLDILNKQLSRHMFCICHELMISGSRKPVLFS